MSTQPRRLITPLVGGFVLLAALLGAAVPPHAQAGAYGDGRAETGARLFRAMLAADTEIERKADATGALRILIVHTGDADRARALGELVVRRDARGTPEPVKGLPVRVDPTRIDDLAAASKKGVAGVFIAEPLSRVTVADLVQFGIEHHVIVYSPFEGDVERGVAGGLSIEAQVRPLVNTGALRAAQVTLREFFLRVAKVYP